MADVRIDQGGAVAQMDATISFTLGEIVRAYKSGTPIGSGVAVDQMPGFELQITAQLMEAVNPVPVNPVPLPEPLPVPPPEPPAEG